jgi:hypothetical protein
MGNVSFPMLIFAGIIVSAGIFYASQWDSTSGWLFAFLILLTIAFAYPTFGSELSKLLGNTTSTTVLSPNAASNGSVLVGPTGPLTSGG